MRVYLPATFRTLASAIAAGEFGPPALLAYAVTPALTEWYASGDAEELEYAALTDAGRECLRLLAREGDGLARRVVVAADVPDSAVTLTPDLHPGAVTVTVAVRLADVAAVHVDPREAEADIRAAVAAVNAADAGDSDAGFIVDGVEDYDLHWYATQEIDDVLATAGQ